MSRSLILQFALFFYALFARGQGTFLYDQQSATNTGPRGGDADYPILLNQPMGQSFTPTLSSIGFVQMKFDDFLIGNGIGATVYLNLRVGSVSGTILSSTAPVFMPDRFFSGTTNFFFSTPVSVAPGTMYYIEPVALPGSDDRWGIVGSQLYGYPGGSALFQG